MALYLAVNKDGQEVCSNNSMFRHHEAAKDLVEKFGASYNHCFKKDDCWCNTFSDGYYTVPRFNGVVLPKGSIKKLIRRELTWSDEPVEI